MKKATRDPMRHVRLTVPGDPGSDLKHLDFEQRGVLRHVRRVNHDPTLTAMHAILDNPSPMQDHDDLRQAAESILTEAGEPSYLQTLMAASAANKDSDGNLDQAAISRAIAAWHNGITERHGVVSRQGVASWFLCSLDYLGTLGELSDGQWSAIFMFAKAWQNLALDESGGHQRIVAAEVSRSNLASGSDTRHQNKVEKLKALRVICDETWGATANPRFKGNARWIANKHFTNINAKMHTLGHKPSGSPAALEKLVQEAVRLPSGK